MRLRQRIQLQRNEPTQDATGQPVESWQVLRRCWASIQDGSRGNTEELASKLTAVRPVNVYIRYPKDGAQYPYARDRVVYDEGDITRTLNIESIQRLDESRRLLLLECTEEQDG